MLVETVVITGDRTCADIGARADLRVTDIGEMVDLGAGADLGLLDLDEIADLGLLRQPGPGAQAGEGTDLRPGADLRALDMGEGMDDGVVTDADRRGRKKTFGSITTSRPITVSALRCTLAGSISVAPPVMARARRRLCITRFCGGRSWARSLTPWTRSSGARTTAIVSLRAAASATASVR